MSDKFYFCTLFDIKCAPYGIVMYESLSRYCKSFHLYVFAFCDETYRTLVKLDLPNVTVIALAEFEDEALLRIKPTRTQGEYCWTCASSTLWYCLTQLNLPLCTYLDADLCFYAAPDVLIDEIGDDSILITEHRYTPQYNQEDTCGRYCVQFMTIRNNEDGRIALKWWRDACIDWCYARFEDGKFGDQKYLDDWTDRFRGVHVLKHLGGGVAPWNLQQYNFRKGSDGVWLVENSSCSECQVVFFHFHNVKIQPNGYVDDQIMLLSYNIDKNTQYIFYRDYIKLLNKASNKLHGISKKCVVVKKHWIPVFMIRKKSRSLRHWILTFNLSKKSRKIRVLGIWIVRG